MSRHSRIVPRPHFSSRPKRFRSRGPCENVRPFPACSPRIRHRNELTERDWENAVQGLGKRHSPFLGRNANGNSSSETSRPLVTSSLAVSGFAAKKGSLRSPRARLLGSLAKTLQFEIKNSVQYDTIITRENLGTDRSPWAPAE